MEYKEIRCPICERYFKEKDDIVVCPKCGAPYHRECYFEKGACIFIDLHEKNETWKPAFQEPPQAPDTQNEPKDNTCPRCGRINTHSALFCDICGFSLSGSPREPDNASHSRPIPPNPYQESQNPYSSFPNGNAPYQPPYQTNPMGGAGFVMDPLGGFQKDEPVDDNVTAEEVACVVQKNSPYYLNFLRFFRMFGRKKFNFSACLFSGAWLLYRKQYKLGALFSALFILFTLVGTYLSYALIMPMIINTFGSLGLDITAGYTYAQLFEVISHLMETEPSFYPVMLIYSVVNIARLALMIICGINGNRWYMNSCIKTVKTVKDENPNNPYVKELLMDKGGVNVPLAICILVCYMIITYLPQFLML